MIEWDDELEKLSQDVHRNVCCGNTECENVEYFRRMISDIVEAFDKANVPFGDRK